MDKNEKEIEVTRIESEKDRNRLGKKEKQSERES